MPPSIIASPLPETRPRLYLESRWIGYPRKNTVPSSVLGCTLPETRPRVDLESRWIGYPRKNTVPSTVLGSTLPETRPRADPEFCWIDWSSSEENCASIDYRQSPAGDTAEGALWSPAGLATLGRTLFHRFSAVTLPETRPRVHLESRWIGYPRKNTVPSTVLGCPLPETRPRWTWESRWIGYPRKNTVRSSVLGCTLPETRPRDGPES